jgi:hypothetical protein
VLRRRPPPSRFFLREFFALPALFALALPAPAWAAGPGPKDAQAQKALKQAIEEDYFETRFDDAEQKLRGGLAACGPSGCSANVRAQLHAALGALLAAGKKQLDDSRDEFVAALELDPKIQPDPGMVTTEVSFAYEAARKQLKLAPLGGPTVAPPPPPGPVAEPPKDAPKKPRPRPEPTPDDKLRDDKPKEPLGPPPKSRKNWITLSFAPDISIVSGTNVCRADVQTSQHYVCVRDNGKRYSGTPTLDNADNINTGLGLSTLRLMLAYDRVIIDSLTLGARFGFAFNGSGSVAGASFNPFHAEARVGYWPGSGQWSVAGVRPYLMVSGGLAQIDTKVSVQVLEDGNACGAKNPGDTTSPCTLPAGDAPPRIQTLTVYKQAGLGFAALSFGVHFAPTPMVALYLAVRGNITFPVVTGVLSPEGGLALGF